MRAFVIVLSGCSQGTGVVVCSLFLCGDNIRLIADCWVFFEFYPIMDQSGWVVAQSELR